MPVMLCILVSWLEYLLASARGIGVFIVDNRIQMWIGLLLPWRPTRFYRPGLIAAFCFQHYLLHIGVHLIIIHDERNIKPQAIREG